MLRRLDARGSQPGNYPICRRWRQDTLLVHPTLRCSTQGLVPRTTSASDDGLNLPFGAAKSSIPAGHLDDARDGGVNNLRLVEVWTFDAPGYKSQPAQHLSMIGAVVLRRRG